MKKKVISLLMLCSLQVFADENMISTTAKQYITPQSSQVIFKDKGRKAHTNVILYKPNRRTLTGLPGGETPASIACIYGLTAYTSGCPKTSTAVLPYTGFGTIVIVDAFYNPDIESDLGVFSTEFNLPACTVDNGCLSIDNLQSSLPYVQNPGWSLEQDLDVQWAHAMAPNASIHLIQANSNSLTDLFTAVQAANTYLLDTSQTWGIVSMSWGGSEFSDEINYDTSYFSEDNIYLASTGDHFGPTSYPSSSPNVIACGGTSIIRDNQGGFVGEKGWDTSAGGTGGPSLYEPRPLYQEPVSSIVGNQRGTPDISFDADPFTGVDVYSTAYSGWVIAGGTSVSSPSLAGIISSSINPPDLRELVPARMRGVLSTLYSNLGTSYLNDIIIGSNGYPALPGYDLITGVGTPNSYLAFIHP